MNSENKHQETVVNVGGAKRKNGHKATCGCHICENIMNKAKRGDYKPKVASGKVNGHKTECRCPICKNMMAKKMKAKRGGAEGDEWAERERRAFATLRGELKTLTELIQQAKER